MPPDDDNDLGLSAEEKAAYDSMRSDPAPQGDAGYVPPDPPADPTPPAQEGGAAPAAGEGAPPAAGAPAAGAGDTDTDDDDEPAVTNPDGTVRTPKRVSFNKFKRVQDEAAKTAKELADERAKSVAAAEKQARLDERLRLLNEALTPQAAPAKTPEEEDPEPDPETDLFAHMAWQKRQLQRTQQRLEELSGNLQEGARASAEEQELATTYMSDAEQFASKEPNFLPAYNYLWQVRIAQLANYYYGIDVTAEDVQPLAPQQVQKIKDEIVREEKQLVAQAIKQNKSPAGAIYAMARMTGYRPQAPGAPAAAAGAPPAQNGAAGAPAAGGAPSAAAAVAAAPAAANGGAAPANGAAKPSVKEEIDKIKAGQDAALSLSRGGGAPAPVLNAEKLANMPEQEFGQLLESMSRGDLRRIMGEGG